MEKVIVKVILDKGVTKPMYMTEGAAGMDVMISKIHTETSGGQILWISPLRPLFYCIC